MLNDVGYASAGRQADRLKLKICKHEKHDK